jgi:signal transduction histidine kinase
MPIKCDKQRDDVFGQLCHRGVMLSDFVKQNRAEILKRSRDRVAQRSAPLPTDVELEKGIPLFLDQLAESLSAPDDGAFAPSATKHGGDLLRSGFSIAQVVHDYGDVCQAITGLALDQGAPIPTDDFRLLNKRLDDAIAGAVTEYQRLRERSRDRAETERLGYLAHELRNKVHTAMLAYGVLKQGQLGLGGSTGAVLERALRGLQDLITQSLAEVRVDAGLQHRERVEVSELVEELEAEASMAANAAGRKLSVASVEPGLQVDADRPLLAAALANILNNAVKFTPEGGHVSLRTVATKDHVTFEVEDECGGLPSTDSEELFTPWTQRSTDKKGLGLGLPLTRRSVQANGGNVSVRNLPGKGCVFAVRMLRPARPKSPVVRPVA